MCVKRCEPPDSLDILLSPEDLAALRIVADRRLLELEFIFSA